VAFSAVVVGMGVWEFRIDFGPGYRVYFGQESDDVVVILNGGSKKTQSSDIASAKVYWKDWNA
jgi:putative addiction module killer protein